MAYADPDAVTQIANGLSTTTFTYDNNGNVTQKTTDGTTTTYVYDYANRLTALGAGGATTTYGYDAFGQRVLQTGTTTTYIYPFKWYSVASSTGSGARFATTTDYVFNGDRLVATVDQQTASGNATGTAKTRYIHPDHLGSTNVVTDENDAVVQTLDYYPYGATRISTNTGGADSARKYVNRFADQSNLDYLNARYYDSARGQFITEDPIFWSSKQNLANPQSLNSYSYANDNPITGKDPDGLASDKTTQILSLYNKALNLMNQILSAMASSGNSVSYTAAPPKPALPQVTPSYISPPTFGTVNIPMRSSTWDSTSNTAISALNPRVQGPTTNFINDTEDWEGIKLRVVQGLRTNEEQDALYASSRPPNNGPWRTNARGGQSYHNYGMAVDVVPINSNGTANWGTPGNPPITPAIAAHAEKYGFVWGQTFPTPDNDHFEMHLININVQ
jgi:RHS repeat-associated protein